MRRRSWSSWQAGENRVHTGDSGKQRVTSSGSSRSADAIDDTTPLRHGLPRLCWQHRAGHRRNLTSSAVPGAAITRHPRTRSVGLSGISIGPLMCSGSGGGLGRRDGPTVLLISRPAGGVASVLRVDCRPRCRSTTSGWCWACVGAAGVLCDQRPNRAAAIPDIWGMQVTVPPPTR